MPPGLNGSGGITIYTLNLTCFPVTLDFSITIDFNKIHHTDRKNGDDDGGSLTNTQVQNRKNDDGNVETELKKELKTEPNQGLDKVMDMEMEMASAEEAEPHQPPDFDDKGRGRPYQ